ncbi:hypothetical protein EON65_36510 [archaeon]|nr:MAG: hypothetical protein EON65_36510 [archaeon]
MSQKVGRRKHICSGGGNSEEERAGGSSATQEEPTNDEIPESESRMGKERSIKLSTRSDDNSYKDHGDSREVPVEVAKPSVKEVYKKPEEVSRNRRLLGSLMGHLGSAKQKLEQDSELLQMQSSKGQSALSKRDRDAQDAKQQEGEKRRKVAQDRLNVAIQDVIDNSKKWKEHVKKEKELLMTTFEPRLTWIPSNHCAVTQDMLTNRSLEVWYNAFNIYA